MAGPLKDVSEYQGERRFKWLVAVIDRSTGQVRPYFMPHSIMKMLRALQENEDYAFDEIPMQYDLTVNAKGAGTREVEYTLTPARKSIPLTAEEHAAVVAFGDLADYQKQLREKKQERTFDPDNVPAGEIPA